MNDRIEDGPAEAGSGVVWPADTDPRETDVPDREEKSPEPARAPDGTRYALVRADAVEWLRTLPDASVDLVVTDPPYESLEKHRAVGTTTRLSHSKSSSNDWFTVFPNARFPELFAEVHRVLKKNAHFYLYCDQETAFVAKPVGEAAGFKFWKPLVWDKCSIGMGYHYRSRYELILFFEKGKRKLANLGTRVPDQAGTNRRQPDPASAALVTVGGAGRPGQDCAVVGTPRPHPRNPEPASRRAPTPRRKARSLAPSIARFREALFLHRLTKLDLDDLLRRALALAASIRSMLEPETDRLARQIAETRERRERFSPAEPTEPQGPSYSFRRRNT